MANIDVLKGKWHEIKGSVRERWGELTDDDIERANGNAEKLAGVIQQKYGQARERIEREIADGIEANSRGN
jgi:uncharacterized protein YjbJ (UPF0337 family)